MQDIITTKEQVQQFERMQTLQLWMIAEVSKDSQSKAMPTSVKYCGQLISSLADREVERPDMC